MILLNKYKNNSNYKKTRHLHYCLTETLLKLTFKLSPIVYSIQIQSCFN